MTEALVLWQVDQGIATITLNRPQQANALSAGLLEALAGVASQLEKRSDIRVAIVTGAGEKAFCAGADLKERLAMPQAAVPQAVALIRNTINAVAALPFPVIAAINGGAFGGGAELALACDLRVAVASAKLGLTETSLAIIPGAGGTQRLSRLIGVAKAKELIYTARRIDADTALALGLINQLVADGELMPAVLRLAGDIARNGPVAVRQAKLAIDRGLDVDLPTGLAIEASAYEGVISTEDRLEGLQAFAEKRPPDYRGY